MLLVDEVDRADDEFEAFLLEVLSTWQVTIPELGTVTAAVPPVVVLTSNRTRELHDALKRRCLYHWLEHPGIERELAIVPAERRRSRPRSPSRSCEPCTASGPTGSCSSRPGSPRPSTGRGRSHELGTGDLDTETAAATLGVAVKYREDAERVRRALDTMLGR